MDPTKVPSPGSPEAVAQGCTCPVLDNRHGRGSLWGDGLFVMVEGCPVHVNWRPKPEELAAIHRFVDLVNARAERNMLKTKKLEGSHHNAIKHVLEQIDPKPTTKEDA